MCRELCIVQVLPAKDSKVKLKVKLLFLLLLLNIEQKKPGPVLVESYTIVEHNLNWD